MEKFFITQNDIPVTLMQSSKGKDNSYPFIRQPNKQLNFNFDIGNDQKLYELLVDIVGKRKAEDVFYSIVNQYVGDILIEFKDKRYKICLNKSFFPRAEYIESVEEIIQKAGINVPNEEIKEIKACIDLWLDTDILNDFQNTDILISDSGIKAMKKGVFWTDFDGDIRLKTEIANITSKRRTPEIINKLKQQITSDNQALIQVGTKYYLLKIVADFPTFREYTEDPYNNIIPILKNYMSDDDVNLLLHFPPKWIPRGFKYLKGTVDTGYVIVNEYGDEFIYDPSSNVYYSHLISKGEDGKLHSIKKREPIYVNLETSYDLIYNANFIDEEFYNRSAEGRFEIGLYSNYYSLARSINNKLAIGYKLKDLNHIHFLISEAPCLSSRIIPSYDELDAAYGYTTYDSSYEKLELKSGKFIHTQNSYDPNDKLNFRVSLMEYIPIPPTNAALQMMDEDARLKKEAQKIKKELEHKKRLKELVYGKRVYEDPFEDDC